MLLRKYINITVALAVSTLLHGVFVFYKTDGMGEDVVDAQASVTVQVSLISKTAAPVEARKTNVPVIDRPVAAESAPLLTGVDEQQEERLDQNQPVAQEAQLVDAMPADFSDVREDQQSRNAGARADQLGKYIHEAINRHKRYPYMARRQHREGLVRLNFVMHPDGQVTDIAIIESSRFQALDAAARQAVQAISPFHMAAEYLQMRHDYNVDIDFRLN